MDIAVSSYMSQAVTTLLLICFPIVAAAAIVGIVVSALQSATSIRDASSSYALRLLAVGIACYVLYPTIAERLLALGRMGLSSVSK